MKHSWRRSGSPFAADCPWRLEWCAYTLPSLWLPNWNLLVQRPYRRRWKSTPHRFWFISSHSNKNESSLITYNTWRHPALDATRIPDGRCQRRAIHALSAKRCILFRRDHASGVCVLAFTPSNTRCHKHTIAQCAHPQLQVLEGKIPYHYIANTFAIIGKISQGITPRRPVAPVIVDDDWNFMQTCWSQHAASRPSATDIVAVMDRAMIVV